MTSVAEQVEVYDIPFVGIEESIYGWVREALELRHGTANDPEGRLNSDVSDIAAVQHELIRTRQRADRVDELLSKVTQARGRLRRAEEQSKFDADLAYDTASRANSINRRAEFSSARERHADASLDSIEQKRLAHQAARFVSVAVEAFEVVNQVHWSLESIRKDLRGQLHALQFESSLER